MRFHSTPESAVNGEITKLAIIECVASVAIYLCIAAYVGTFKYLAVAVVAAPLMLFRTEVSSEWGLNVYGRFYGFAADKFHKWDSNGLSKVAGLLPWLLPFLITPIVGTTIRIVATLYWTVRRPLHTLSEMPQNWLRQSLCTDFLHVPEILPLEAARGKQHDIPQFAELLSFFLERRGPAHKAGCLIICSPFLLIGWVPSLIYRVSFKATAVAYLPFIWVAHATLRNPMPAGMRLERITKGELEKVRRVLSWGILATLITKFGFVLGWVDWNRIEEKFPSKKLVQSLIVPGGWPWWQITLGADALLTFFLLFFADAALARLNSQQAWGEQSVLGTISTVSFLRAALSLITISHFFRIALLAVAPSPLHRLLAG